MCPVTLSDLNRSKCCVSPHPQGLHALPDRDCLLHGCGTLVLQHVYIFFDYGQFNRNGQKLGRNLVLIFIFFVSYFSFLHPVILSMYLQPQSLPEKDLRGEKRTDSTLGVRLLPGHYSHSFVKAGLISLEALIQENCLEKISGPRLQLLVSWQIQLSPWRHHANGTTLLSVCLSVCLNAWPTSRDVVREPIAPSWVLGKQNGHLWLVKWWCVLIIVSLLNATFTHTGQKCDLFWSVITTTGC